MPNEKIDAYLASLNYDPRVLLSVVPDGTTSSVPVKTREALGNSVVICTKVQHNVKKNLDEVAILSPTAGVVFPGALVIADQNMVDGHPTPISLIRRPVTVSIDLPGLADPNGTVMPEYSEIQKFLNGKLEMWNTTPASQQGYVNAARSILQVTKAFASQQVALDLGFNAKWASGSASGQLAVSSSTEKSVMVAYYKQVFYTVTMNTPQPASGVFSDDVTLEQAQQVFNHSQPPAYVRSVDYGRLLLVKMESSTVDTSVNLKGAFEQATTGGVTAGCNLAASYKNIIKNSTFTVLALGGGAASPVQMFNGGADAELTGLRDYVAKDAVYRRDNPGLPIGYTMAFLKDNQFARMGFTTDYVENECVRYNNGFVRLVHDGAYVAKFQVTWVEPDMGGHYTVNRQWDSGEKTAGYTNQLDLPGDAQGVRIRAWAATGLIWDPWGEIMNISLNGPDNKTYRARGTTLNRSWDNG
jgi:thiol-activated cytolysin